VLIKDVTLTIEPDMPVWPGDDRVHLIRRQKLEEGESSNVSFLSLSVHTGTHIDAPFHFLGNGKTIDQISMDHLIGETQVVEISSGGRQIDVQLLNQSGVLQGVKRVLFKTDNSRIWEQGVKQFQEDFVALEENAAAWLVEKGIITVGIDYLSIAPFTQSRPTHETLLNAGILIIEGLDLRDVDSGMWRMFCLPLKLSGSDGAPARVILTREETPNYDRIH
jgi:arylformamidase